MKTEIVIPFTFDTAPIEQMMQEQGMDEAHKILERIVQEQVIDKVPKERDYYGYERAGARPDWKGLLEQRIDKFVSDNAETIIDEAALLLVMRGSRKAKWRDVLAEYKRQEVDE